MDPVVRELLGPAHPLARHIGEFLTDLTNTNASRHTLRAYRGDLTQFAAHHDEPVGALTATPVRAFLAEAAGLAPATRKTQTGLGQHQRHRRAVVLRRRPPPLEDLCATAGVDIDIHQLRHAHATELINSGVSIEAVRRRLGHASTETTQLYTLLDDKVADAEIRAARRRHDRAGR